MLLFDRVTDLRMETKDGKLVRSRDGYIKGYANAARVGVQSYRGSEVERPDLDKVKVYRPAEQVFHRDSMHTAAHRPITLNHPPEMVNDGNWKKYAVGYIGDEVIRDGDHIRVPLMLCDRDAINAYEKGGVGELSVGYHTDLKWTPGTTPQGETYDAIQTDIRWNHLAMVPRARGGDTLRLGDTQTCPKCGAAVSEYNRTCTSCGATLLPRTTATVNPPKIPGARSKDRFQSSDADGDNVCPNCGEKGLSDDIEICPACFTPMDDPDDEDDFTDHAAFYDREFSTEKRKELAKSGKALPGGGFPIENVGDLKNAVRAIGRAKNPGKAKAHIIARAKALGATKELPEDWSSSTKDAAISGNKRSELMSQIMIDGIPVELNDRDAAVVQRHFQSLTTQLRDAKKAEEAANEEMEAEKKLRKEDKDKMQANCDAMSGEIKVLKKQIEDGKVTPQALDAMVKDRTEVIGKAATILGDKAAFDGKSVPDIKRACVSVALGDAAVKPMNDDAVAGAFAAMTATAKSGVHALGDSISNGLRDLHRPGFPQQDGAMSLQDAEAARLKAFNDRQNMYENAWRTSQAKQ